MSYLNLSWQNLRQCPLILSLVAGKERVTTNLATTSFRSAIKIPLSLLRLNNQSFLSCSSQDLLSRLFISFVTLWTCYSFSMSFLQWGAHCTGLRCSVASTNYSGTITALVLLSTPFLTQHKVPLVFFAPWAQDGCQPALPVLYCWAAFQALCLHPMFLWGWLHHDFPPAQWSPAPSVCYPYHVHWHQLGCRFHPQIWHATTSLISAEPGLTPSLFKPNLEPCQPAMTTNGKCSFPPFRQWTTPVSIMPCCM